MLTDFAAVAAAAKVKAQREQDEKLELAVRKLARHSSYGCVRLAHDGLDEDTFSYIAVLLAEHERPLVRLDLDGNALADAGAMLVADVLQAKQSCTSLSLRDCAIGDAGLGAIAGVLGNHRGLRDLDVSAHVASADSVRALADAAAQSATLVRLTIGERALDVQALRGADGATRVALSGVSLGPTPDEMALDGGSARVRLDDLIATCALLCANARLQDLSLVGCGLSGAHAAAAIERVLASCVRVRSLDLRRNRWEQGCAAQRPGARWHACTR